MTLRRSIQVLTVTAALAVAAQARAVVLHRDPQPADRPPSGVIARWHDNASGVVVGPTSIVTVRHAGYGTSATVFVNGVQYKIHSITNHPTADLRVITLLTMNGQPANFVDYTPLYTGTNETSFSQVVIGGYGMTRGATLYSTNGNRPYGYAWTGSANNTLTWGVNRFDSADTAYGTYTTSVLVADFDWIDASGAGEGGAIVGESSPALWDSGGGWFVKSPADGKWYVAGLTRSVESHYDASNNRLWQSWYRDSLTGLVPDPDRLDAVRMSSYATWAGSYIKPYAIVPGDANWDGKVDISDLTTLANKYGKTSGATWFEGDFNADGRLDIADLTIMANYYGYVWSADDDAGPLAVGGTAMGDEGLVPEPASLALLLAGATGLLARRRRTR